MHEEMSQEDLRLRFFAANPRYAREVTARTCTPVRSGYCALVAVDDEQNGAPPLSATTTRSPLRS